MSEHKMFSYTWCGDQYASVIRVLLALVLVSPLIMTPTTDSAGTFGKVVYAQSLIGVTFVLWIPLVILFPKYRLKWSWILIAAATWLGVSALSAAVGFDPGRSFWSGFRLLDGVINLAHWIAYAVMLASVLHSVQRWRQFMMMWVAVAGIVVVIALLLYFWYDLSPYLAKSGANTTVTHPTHLGAYLCVSIGFAVALISQSKSWEEALVWSVFVIASVVTIWLVSARMALVATIVIGVFYAVGGILLSKSRVVKLILLGCLVLVAIGIAILSLLIFTIPVETSEYEFGQSRGKSGMIERMAKIVKKQDNSVSRRAQAATAAIRAYEERPILGYGPKNFQFAWIKHVPHNEEWMSRHNMLYGFFDDAHSVYLEVMTTTGTLGLLTYGMLCVLMIRAAVRSLLGSSDRVFHLAITATLIGYLTLCVSMVSAPTFLMCFATLIGYFIYLEQNCVRRTSRPMFNNKCAIVLVSIGIVPVVLAGIIVFNASIFSAGQFVKYPNGGRDANERYVPSIHNRMDMFPPLAEAKREKMLTTARWMGWKEKYTGYKLLDEVDKAVEIAPHNWRRIITAAVIYQEANQLEKARYYVGMLEERIPGSPYTVVLRRNQNALEWAAANEWIHKSLP